MPESVRIGLADFHDPDRSLSSQARLAHAHPRDGGPSVKEIIELQGDRAMRELEEKFLR
jgi:hypothetical protein